MVSIVNRYLSPLPLHSSSPFFFFNDPATTEIYTLSLHDALPISICAEGPRMLHLGGRIGDGVTRSEEHTSELQSRRDLVCRLLLEKKKEGRKECVEIAEQTDMMDREQREEEE